MPHKRVKSKLCTARGFSLAELMLTMLILALMTGMAAQGIPVVISVYQRAVNTANAETYLNTTMIALRTRLCVASDSESDEEKTYVTYTDPKTGRLCKIFKSNDGNGEINVQEGINMSSPPLPNPLMSSGNEGFVSTYDTIEYTNTGFFIITGLQVSKNGTVLATLDADFVIHTLNP